MNLLIGPIMYQPPSYTPELPSIFLESVLYLRPYSMGSTVAVQNATTTIPKTRAKQLQQLAMAHPLFSLAKSMINDKFIIIRILF
jgi:hypothetical protein